MLRSLWQYMLSKRDSESMFCLLIDLCQGMSALHLRQFGEYLIRMADDKEATR